MKKLSRDRLKKLALETHRAKFPTFPEYARPIKAYSDTKANGLTKCIIDFLNYSGHQAERINNMGRRIDKRKIVTDVVGNIREIGSVEYMKSTMTPGTADISCTLNGRSLKVEVKIGSDRQSQAQINYEQAITRAGGIYIIARDFDSFLEWYDNFILCN